MSFLMVLKKLKRNKINIDFNINTKYIASLNIKVYVLNEYYFIIFFIHDYL